jgi:hypothetical protein
MFDSTTLANSLALTREALAKALPNSDLQKAWVQSSVATTGLTMYSLEAPAKLLVPQITPLRNSIPRVTGGQGIQANWKAITGVNTGMLSIGIAEGRRGGVNSTTTQDYMAKFVQLGLDDNVTFEAQLAGEGFDDVRARATQALLMSMMIGEEAVILAGQGSFGLGTTPTPTLTTATTGGSIVANTNVFVKCVALTLEGYMAARAGTVRAQVSRTNADGTTETYGGGSARASAAANLAVGASGNLHVINASVTPVTGAVGYAWFVGTVGTQRLYGVTTINSVVINAVPAGAEQVLPADLDSNDRSQNGLYHDGFLALGAKAGSGAYLRSLPTGVVGTGSPLTSDGTGGIVEIDTALEWYWNQLRISPTEIWVNSQEMGSIRKKVLAAGSAATQRFTFVSQQGQLTAASVIRGYLNQFALGGATEIPIRIHPNVPPGMMFFLTHSIPYPLSGVGSVNRILCRKDYHQIDWPLRTRMHEFGVYSDQVLQCYFTPGIGIIQNIAPG